MSDATFIYEDNVEPFKQYVDSDKSIYKRASDTINPKTGRKYIDPFNYMLVDDNGAFLMNIDFKFVDTQLFREVSIFKKKNGSYTPHRVDSLPYERFRKREEYRRKNGLTMPCKSTKDGTFDLHISGEFYNFLNYGRVQKLDIEAIKRNIEALAEKKFDFPDFIDFQFWYTTVKDFAIRNGFNLITLKSRRKGASFMEGIDSANEVNLHPDKVVIHAAGDKKYLTKAGALSNMSYRQLLYYENETPFIRGAIDDYGMPKGLRSDNLEQLELGYVLKNHTKAGWNSILFSVSTKNEPGAAVGKDAKKIKCDELNDFPNFSDFMAVTDPATTTGAFKTGTISSFGTGGAKSGNWASFESNYTETKKYNHLPFSNVWDKDSRNETVGFFMPFWWGLQGVNKNGDWTLDEFGNTNYDIAIELSNHERSQKRLETGIGRDYILHCSQFANRPSEAFNSGSETILSSLELKDHIKNLKTNNELKFYTDGDLIETDKGLDYKSNEWLYTNGIQIHPYIDKVPFSRNDDFAGCFRMYHKPYKIEGTIPDKLYFCTYDPVGSEIKNGEIEDYHSLASIQVWMAANNISHSPGKILVATWIGRRDGFEEMDRKLYDVARYYNAKVLPEMDRGNVKANFIKFKALGLILPDPTEVLLNRNAGGGNQRSYGMIIGSGSRKTDGIDYLKEFLYEKISVGTSGQVLRRFHFIYDLPFLIECDKFRLKGNFDRVSSGILAAYQFNLNDAIKSQPKYYDKNHKSLESILLGR